MKPKALRTLDPFGRILLPKEFTSALLWTTETKISIVKRGRTLVLEAAKDCCSLCGSEHGVRCFGRFCVCEECLKEIREKTDEAKSLVV